MPPFTRYSWLTLDDKGHNYLKFKTNDKYDTGSVSENCPELYETVADQWGKQSQVSGDALMFKAINSAISVMYMHQSHEIQLRFIDVEKSHIDDWKDWYGLVKPKRK